jgi:hypothetical protein
MRSSLGGHLRGVKQDPAGVFHTIWVRRSQASPNQSTQVEQASPSPYSSPVQAMPPWYLVLPHSLDDQSCRTLHGWPLSSPELVTGS